MNDLILSSCSHDFYCLAMTDSTDLWRSRFGIEPPVNLADANASLVGMLGRRSQRSFKSDPIDAGLLSLLLACAQSAPSKSDLQQYSILVVDDPIVRAEIQKWASFDDWIGKAPAFLIFCGDVRRQRRISEMHGFAHENDSLDTFMNTSVDAGIALATFIAAAEAAGVGCCPISVVRNHMEEARRLFALPKGVYPVAGLALGYVEHDADVRMRLPPALVVHKNKYDDSNLENEIRAYDIRRHETAPIAPEKQRHAGLYGEQERVTWSENAARQMSVPERAGLLDFLRKWGFSLT